MFILHVCDKAIYDRMNKGPKHKESKFMCWSFRLCIKYYK